MSWLKWILLTVVALHGVALADPRLPAPMRARFPGWTLEQVHSHLQSQRGQAMTLRPQHTPRNQPKVVLNRVGLPRTAREMEFFNAVEKDPHAIALRATVTTNLETGEQAVAEIPHKVERAKPAR